MNAIAQTDHATAGMSLLMSRVREAMAARGAHAARTVVLMPYLHLLAPAREAWAAGGADGFAPRFETTWTWSRASLFEYEADGISRDMARDLLTARSFIERAGLRTHADLLARRLVEAAWQLAPVVAAVPAHVRQAWAAQARAAVAHGLEAGPLALESAIARIAIEWAAASSCPTDVLFDDGTLADVDMLVVVEGLQPEALAKSLAASAPHKSLVLDLATPAPVGGISLHEAKDPSDEAQQAAACVIAHVNAGRLPVALAAVDRELTRRIHAMLASHGVAVRDETGWKLSTTRRAADLVLALRACAWNAASDDVIDWLKNSPQVKPFGVLAIERRLRRIDFVREWRSFTLEGQDSQGGVADTLRTVNEWREGMQAVRTLPQWLASLQQLLAATGQWTVLERDPAGLAVIDALGLAPDQQQDWQRFPHAARRWSLADLTSWVNESLEARAFKPDAGAQEQVVIVPVGQVAGRAFAALVMPGCDEMRLVASPEPAGIWTPAQRAALGLPSRETLEAQTRSAWSQALQVPRCDLLWRSADENGEPLLPAPLVLSLRLDQGLSPGCDPREQRSLPAQPTPRPAATGRLLAITQLSSSTYGDLRACPYRFFAMRQLGLQEADEIDAEVDKRHFGNWLHRVLSVFHESLRGHAAAPASLRLRLIEDAAIDATAAMRLDEGEFLPFAAAWPKVRDGYLDWLARHEEREGARFAEGEGEHALELGPVKLVGRIDRIDRLADGTAYVMDYKTEAQGMSRDRVRDPGEDTQLAFYAALLHDDTLRAAYVNVSEKETRTVEQPRIVEARDLLVEGILHDVARIAAGDVLPAHGEGRACEFCGARGLCRKDFWE